ncbi:MAG: aspartate 1-decarboxylase [Pseudomonadota bacterium]|jgi:aspartate 1-decarboxylase
MLYNMLAGKIHRATVTDANLEYEGSITIDQDLMEAARIVPFAQVQIYNITNGNRFETYAIEGRRGSGEVVINGAAAHKAAAGDLVIIACYVQVEAAQAAVHKPSLVYVDNSNAIIEVKNGMVPANKAAAVL